MINKIKSFFKRIFTEDPFPGRQRGRMDKQVGEVYNVKTYDSTADGKMLVVLDPKDEFKGTMDEFKEETE